MPPDRDDGWFRRIAEPRVRVILRGTSPGCGNVHAVGDDLGPVSRHQGVVQQVPRHGDHTICPLRQQHELKRAGEASNPAFRFSVDLVVQIVADPEDEFGVGGSTCREGEEVSVIASRDDHVGRPSAKLLTTGEEGSKEPDRP